MDPQALQHLQNAIVVLTFVNLAWTVSNIAIAIVGKIKSPNVRQDERITALETNVAQLKEFLDNDNRRIKSIEAGNRVTQQGLLALMSHALNGNDVDKLEKARDDLQSYLISREL